MTRQIRFSKILKNGGVMAKKKLRKMVKWLKVGSQRSTTFIALACGTQVYLNSNW